MPLWCVWTCSCAYARMCVCMGVDVCMLGCVCVCKGVCATFTLGWAQDGLALRHVSRVLVFAVLAVPVLSCSGSSPLPLALPISANVWHRRWVSPYVTCPRPPSRVDLSHTPGKRHSHHSAVFCMSSLSGLPISAVAGGWVFNTGTILLFFLERSQRQGPQHHLNVVFGSGCDTCNESSTRVGSLAPHPQAFEVRTGASPSGRPLVRRCSSRRRATVVPPPLRSVSPVTSPHLPPHFSASIHNAALLWGGSWVCILKQACAAVLGCLSHPTVSFFFLDN